MKNILIVTLLLISFSGKAQMGEKTKGSPTFKKEYFRYYYIFPSAFGDNALAKAHAPKGGFGASLTIYSINNLFIVWGYETAQYKVTDITLTGNVGNTNYNNLYNEVFYKFPISNKLSINPKIAVGYTWVGQRSSYRYYGRQEGITLTAGGNLDFTIICHLRAYGGVNYNFSILNTNTAPEYKSFYSNLHQVHFILGLKI